MPQKCRFCAKGEEQSRESTIYYFSKKNVLELTTWTGYNPIEESWSQRGETEIGPCQFNAKLHV